MAKQGKNPFLIKEEATEKSNPFLVEDKSVEEEVKKKEKTESGTGEPTTIAEEYP